MVQGHRRIWYETLLLIRQEPIHNPLWYTHILCILLKHIGPHDAVCSNHTRYANLKIRLHSPCNNRLWFKWWLMDLFKMTVVVYFMVTYFYPSSENAFIGDNIQYFMQCLLANSTVVRWLSYVVCGSCT